MNPLQPDRGKTRLGLSVFLLYLWITLIQGQDYSTTMCIDDDNCDDGTNSSTSLDYFYWTTTSDDLSTTAVTDVNVTQIQIQTNVSRQVCQDNCGDTQNCWRIAYYTLNDLCRLMDVLYNDTIDCEVYGYVESIYIRKRCQDTATSTTDTPVTTTTATSTIGSSTTSIPTSTTVTSSTSATASTNTIISSGTSVLSSSSKPSNITSQATTTASKAQSTVSPTTTADPRYIIPYPMPVENLMQIQYNNSCAHNWHLSPTDPTSLEDLCNTVTPLTVALDNRWMLNDTVLNNTYGSVFATNRTVFKRRAVTPLLSEMDRQPISSGQSIVIGGPSTLSLANGKTCIRLTDFSTEHPYVKACLTEPEKCDYGFSMSLWVRFMSDSFTNREVLLATGPAMGQGFILYYERMKLVFVVTGTTKKWSASITMNKLTDRWQIVAATWNRYTGGIVLYNDTVSNTFTYGNTENQMTVQPSPASAIYLGCDTNVRGIPVTTNMAKILANHAVFWLWPVANSILFAGSIGYQLVIENARKGLTTTPAPTPPPSGILYQSFMVEYVAPCSGPNPIYTQTSEQVISPETLDPWDVVGTGVGLRTSQDRPRTPSFRLNSNNAMLKVINKAGDCFMNAINCGSGLSFSLWTQIPTAAISLTTPSDLFEIVNVFYVTILDCKFYVTVVRGGDVFTYATKENIQVGLWINFGFAITSLSPSDANRTLKAAMYINCRPVELETVSKSPVTDRKLRGGGLTTGDILIGSGAVGRSMSLALLNDLVLWAYYLHPFQAHTFCGQTMATYNLLVRSTHFWTPDCYVHADAVAFNKTNTQTSLRSLYRPNRAIFSTDDDPFLVARAPILTQSIDNYLMLGRRKINVPNRNDFSWFGLCLTDPQEASCRANGMTIVTWLKIISVNSKNKLRYYLNTGDIGYGMASFDSRGVAIFTSGNLFGMSVSTTTQKFTVLMDSSLYKLNEWFPVVLLWRSDVSLKMLPNGLDFGLEAQTSSSRFMPLDRNYRAVVGRMDFDNEAAWRGEIQRLWEMSNFVSGPIAFFDQMLPVSEIQSLLGIEPNILYYGADFVATAESILNIPLKYRIEARNLNSNLRLTPRGRIHWNSVSFAAVFSNSELNLRVLSVNSCPGSLSLCTSGLTVAAWLHVRRDTTSDDTLSWTANVFSTQKMESIDEGFGLRVDKMGKFTAWLRCGGKAWSVSSDKTFYNRWVNAALIWQNRKTLFIYVNGQKEGTNSTPADVSLTSGNDTTYVILTIADRANIPKNANLSIHSLIYKSQSLTDLQSKMFTGLIRSQQVLLNSAASYYWTFFGSYQRLQTPKPTLNMLTYSVDRFQNPNAAVCTAGSAMSYLSIDQLQTTCFYEPSLCSVISITLSVKFPVKPADGIVFTSGGHVPGLRGLSIEQLSNTTLRFTVRTADQTCPLLIEFNNSNWVQIRWVWYASGRSPTLFINGMTTTYLANYCFLETNRLNNSSQTITFGASNQDFSSGLAFCLTDIAVGLFTPQDSFTDVNTGQTSSSCYKDQDYYYPLNGDNADYNNRPSQSSNLSSVTTPLGSLEGQCLSDPSLCSTGITFSLWVKVTGFLQSSTTNNVSLLSTGSPDIDRGVTLALSDTTGDNLDATVTINDGTSQWKTRVSNAFPKNTWTNLGVAFSVSSAIISFYVNGILKQQSSKFIDFPIEADKVFDLKINQLPDGGDQPLLQGSISDVVIWASVKASCQSPRVTHQLLTGVCSPNTNLPTTASCPSISNCEKISGAFCLDVDSRNLLETLSNLKMGMVAISTVKEMLQVATIASKIVDNDGQNNVSIITAGAQVLRNACNTTVSVNGSEESSTAIPSVLNTIGGALDSIVKQMKVFDSSSAVSDQPNNLDSEFIQTVETCSKRQSTFAYSLPVQCSPTVTANAGVESWLIKTSETCGNLVYPMGSDTSNDTSIAPATNYSTLMTKNYSITLPINSFAPYAAGVSLSIFDGKSQAGASLPDNNTVNGVEVRVSSYIIAIDYYPVIRSLNSTINDTIILVMPLQKPIQDPPKPLRLLKSTTIQDNTTRIILCSYYNTDSKVWSQDGCNLLNYNTTHVTCQCDHLTSFAVLMEPQNYESAQIHELVLRIIAGAGGILSLITLLILLVVVISSRRNLLGDRLVIHVNFIVALFIAIAAFLIVEITNATGDLCRVLGIIMHLFYLAAYSWLLVESLYLFYGVTSGSLKGRIIWYFCICWLFAGVIVGLIAGMDVNAYGQNALCWLSVENYKFWTFLGVLLSLNVFTLIVLGITTCNLSTPALKRQEIVDTLRVNINQTFAVAAFTTLCWIFGCVLVLAYSIPMAYLFFFFNSLQGVWIFVVFGLFDPRISIKFSRKKHEVLQESEVDVRAGKQEKAPEPKETMWSTPSRSNYGSQARLVRNSTYGDESLWEEWQDDGSNELPTNSADGSRSGANASAIDVSYRSSSASRPVLTPVGDSRKYD